MEEWMRSRKPLQFPAACGLRSLTFHQQFCCSAPKSERSFMIWSPAHLCIAFMMVVRSTPIRQTIPHRSDISRRGWEHRRGRPEDLAELSLGLVGQTSSSRRHVTQGWHWQEGDGRIKLALDVVQLLKRSHRARSSQCYKHARGHACVFFLY